MKETKLFEFVTGTEMKPWLSRNMLPNINTCENGWSNFSANLRAVSLKLLELTHFAWPNLSIYYNFLCAVRREDVIESTRFLMRPPVNHSTIVVSPKFFQRAKITQSTWNTQEPYAPVAEEAEHDSWQKPPNRRSILEERLGEGIATMKQNWS